MPFFLDTQETVQRFGSAIAEFRSLLDANHVRHGAPDDLFDFAKTLEHSNQFRMDLSVLVKSIVNKERDELLLTDMMSIIAASVGGRSITDTTADITGPTNTLLEFLLGTGCWKQFGSPRPVTQRAAQPSKPEVRPEEPQPIRISLPASPAKSAEAPEDKAGLLEISNELRQTLSRLESNTQQVKLHLDSIERRIGKMETTPKTIPPNKATGLEPLLHRGAADVPVQHVAPPAAEEILPIDPPLPTRGRAVFAGPVPLNKSATAEDDDFSAPTFAYGSEKRRVIIPIVLFVLLAVIAAVAFFYIHSAGKQSFLKSGLARIEGNQSAPAASTPAATPPPVSSSASNAAATSSAPTPPATASEAAPTPAASDAPSAPNNPKLKYVPANVMEGYLLSAPRPEYPPQAREDHIEGQVALQATVSRNGAITSLHVLKGPPSLLSAAVAAVRTWRYRPYSVDGQPQDVATTVYVDFTLKPPPVLVH
jgi:TonB family protein